MKQIFLFIFLILISNPFFAQDAIGKMTLKDGETILLYPKASDDPVYGVNYIIEGNMALTPASLIYFSKEGELKTIKQKRVDELTYGNQLYKIFPIFGSKGFRLQEVIMQNDDYLLTSYFSLANYFYIYRKEDNKGVENAVKHSKKRKNDYKTLEKILPKYFPNCPELMEHIRTNIRNTDYRVLYGNLSKANNKMFKGIQNYICN